MERVIVTGATSMIGEALIEECLKHGISVCAVIRKDTARKDRLPEDPHLELVECSLEELETLPEKVNGTFDTFYHIAWGYTGTARNKSVRLQSKNIDYTLEAVEAAAKLGCRRFIGAGSQAEYGPLDLEKIGPDAPEHPTTAYGTSKLAAGKLSKLLCKELGMEWIWPRIFSVDGIYDKESTMVMTAVPCRRRDRIYPGRTGVGLSVQQGRRKCILSDRGKRKRWFDLLCGKRKSKTASRIHLPDPGCGGSGRYTGDR